MRNFPAVAILGPRQCGKTTLALEIAKESEPSVYVDLERPSDTRNSPILKRTFGNTRNGWSVSTRFNAGRICSP